MKILCCVLLFLFCCFCFVVPVFAVCGVRTQQLCFCFVASVFATGGAYYDDDNDNDAWAWHRHADDDDAADDDDGGGDDEDINDASPSFLLCFVWFLVLQPCRALPSVPSMLKKTFAY